jgi:hypothetical protein
LLTGCQVHTQVTVYEAGSGRGVVTVTVSLDRAALAAVGGEPALAAQLQSADLRAAGWVVTGPTTGPGSTTVITALHAYTTLAQARGLMADLAGSGAMATRPFRLSLAEHRSFWRHETVLQGQVDLRCGVDCFGDSGLTAALGFATGVNPGALAAAAGQRPDQVFTFAVDAHLPGHVVDSNGTPLPGGALQWTPQLGRQVQLSALTRTWNTGRIVFASVAAGALAVLGVVMGVYWWLRFRRRRRGQHRRKPGTAPESVASHS